MAEGEQIGGQHLQARVEKLVTRWSEGRTSLKQIVGMSDEELFAVASQGYYLFLQGKIEEARVIFEGLVAIDPKNAYYYKALGVIYWRMKEAQKALKQFTYAIRVSPKDVGSYVNRAEVYVSAGHYKRARKDLNYVLENADHEEIALVRKSQAILTMIPN